MRSTPSPLLRGHVRHQLHAQVPSLYPHGFPGNLNQFAFLCSRDGDTLANAARRYASGHPVPFCVEIREAPVANRDLYVSGHLSFAEVCRAIFKTADLTTIREATPEQQFLTAYRLCRNRARHVRYETPDAVRTNVAAWKGAPHVRPWSDWVDDDIGTPDFDQYLATNPVWRCVDFFITCCQSQIAISERVIQFLDPNAMVAFEFRWRPPV